MSLIRLPHLAAVLAVGAGLLAGCSTPTNTGGGNFAADTATGDTASGQDSSVGADGAVDAAGGDSAGNDVPGSDSQPPTADIAADVQTGTDATGDIATKDSSPADIGAGSGSCAGNCGAYMSNSTCHCDSYCVEAEDCCADYVDLCTCKTDADCVTGDKCAPGVCVEGGCSATKKDCDDKNDCTTDSCDSATGACANTVAADGSECDANVECKVGACKAGKCQVGGPADDGDLCSDGNPCTESDGCKAGTCAGGGPTDCDDLDECTVDSCDPGSGCLHKDVAANTPCDDGESCTVGDVCTSNGCEGKAEPDGASCDDGESCTTDDLCDGGTCGGKDLPDGAPCDDGDACTSNDSCDWGYCDGDSKGCDDKNGCTYDKCDSKTGACSYEQETDGSWCSDDNPCTSKEECTGGQCVGPVDTVACDDGNPCTTDKCDGAGGTKNCTHTPFGEAAPCDDGDLCTVNDACTSGACIGKAGSCTTAYSDAFDCGATGTWTFSAAAASGLSAWAIDGTPNPPQAKSAACSLNFNNGTNYDDDAKAQGTATSATIALPAKGTIRISFWSWHDTELASNYDNRSIEVSADQFASLPINQEFDNADPAKQWLFKAIDVSALAGKTVQVRFRFDSGDSYNNEGAGWFIDDLKIDVLP
ncbi:MAG: hypothetical protein HY902_00100 [Deltaproteobacteria bacterium]|nr:hypothetical protein [Deltaproteobacteria bacterium]